MKITPIADNVICKLEERAEKTAGGLYIPQNASDDRGCQIAKVIAVGPGKTLDNGRRTEPRVKAGDRVLIGKYSGSTITVEGEEVFTVKEDDIIAVVD